MLSRTAIHAVRALSYLASLPEGTFAGSADLAERIGAPRNYLGKLLQGLAARGLVESRKGTGGGFRLARPAEKISLLDVVEPIDRFSHWRGCLLGGPVCSDDSPCFLHAPWSDVCNRYLDLLAKTSMAQLAEHEAISGRSPGTAP